MARSMSRLLSPAGFGLILVLFLLPFVSVSCEAPGFGTLNADYTGFDLAANAAPSFEVDGVRTERALSDQALPAAGVQVLASTVIALLVVGAATALLSRRRLRFLAGTATAALAAAVLIVTQLLAESNLANASQAQLEDFSPVASEALTDAIGPGIGFLLALTGLAVLAAGNLVAGLRVRQLRPPPPAPPPH